MKTIQSQTIIITDNNQTAKAFIDFCDKSLCVSVVSNNKQFDFGLNENFLKMKFLEDSHTYYPIT